ncbi:hypothetical protein [Kitasatospora sp. SC0581]|uniref:hypothetical protein n=1 Tax=Kitasatospora sp. SC0581 TaxID=3394360 RepID=UPI003A8AE363
MIRVLLMELRRSPLRWWLPALLLIDLAALFGRSRSWIGVWPETSVAAQVPSFYFGPALAAAAAWAAGREGRGGAMPATPTSTRPRFLPELLLLTATLVYGTAVYACGALVAAAVSWSEAGPGFLWPGYLVIGLTVMTGCAAAGQLVGKTIRSTFLAPSVAGLGSLAVLAWVGSPHAFGLFVLSGSPQAQAAPAAVALRVGLALAAAGLALTLPDWWQARRSVLFQARSGLAAVGFGALLVALVAAAPQAGRVQVSRSAPAQPLCTTTTPKLCIWPEERKYLPKLASLSDRIALLPAGLFVVPDTFYEQGLRGPAHQYTDFPISEGSVWTVAESISIQILSATAPPRCKNLTEANTERMVKASWELGRWLNVTITGGPQPDDVHGGPPGLDTASIDQLAGAPQAEQISWVNERLSVLREMPCA